MKAERVIFIGSKQGGLRVLERMLALAPQRMQAIVTLDDRNDARSRFEEITGLGQKNRIDTRVVKNNGELKEFAALKKPDLGFVFGWYSILEPDLLASAPGGFVGIHPSLLPRYRGGAPLVWAIINGESGSGVSLFHFHTGMDDGDIIGQKSFPIRQDETIAEVWSKAQEGALGLIDDHFLDLLDGRAPRMAQDHSKATYCSQRRPQDGRIDWKLPAETIHNFIRAQSDPYPGAFSHNDNGEKVVVLKAAVFAQDYFGVPGLVAQPAGGGVLVCCGSGALVLFRIRLENGQEEDAAGRLRYGMRLA